MLVSINRLKRCCLDGPPTDLLPGVFALQEEEIDALRSGRTSCRHVALLALVPWSRCGANESSSNATAGRACCCAKSQLSIHCDLWLK
jgi:hypothetical protein